MWDKQRISNQDYFNRRRMEDVIKLADHYNCDIDYGYRQSKKECKVCYYNTRIAGQAFTDWSCQMCGKEDHWSNTDTPKLCTDCAKTDNLCAHCGGHINA